MKFSTVLLAAAALAGVSAIASGAVSRQATREEGERCAGAPGYPKVEWIPCEAGTECVESPELGWGKFCIADASATAEPAEADPSPEASPVPDPREEDERCAGAPGYPPVPWIPCEEGLECVADPALGWGKFCKPVGGSTTTPTESPPGTCAPNWNRCEGDEDVAWPTLPCCDSANYECVVPQDESYVGKRCEPKQNVPVTVPGSTTCAADWQTCGGRGAGTLPCCTSGYSCVEPAEENYWGLRCEPAGAGGEGAGGDGDADDGDDDFEADD